MKAPSTILEGVRVLDLSRLAPGPYGSMLLGDMGAEVIIVAGGRGSLPIDTYCRGKSVVTLDLKSSEGRSAFRKLAETADVLIEGYRPGVTKRLGISYEELRPSNERLIYCSVTGYGQDGPLAQEAGHDINYVGMSGLLGAVGPAKGAPVPPLNLVADFAGGGMHAALAIISALYERERTGTGQYLDVSMVDGCISLMAMHYADWGKPVLPARGQGLLTGEAPFYYCHRCSDGKFVAVGALEPAFFANLWHGLGLDEPMPDHMSRRTWPQIAQKFEQAFAERPRDEWVAHFAGKDACVTPVLAPDEVFDHPHNAMRYPDASPDNIPPLPWTTGAFGRAQEKSQDEVSDQMLAELGLDQAEIAAATGGKTAASQGIAWPPVSD